MSAHGDADGLTLAVMAEQAIAGDATPGLELRTVRDPAICHVGRVVGCGPPPAALLILGAPKPRHPAVIERASTRAAKRRLPVHAAGGGGADGRFSLNRFKRLRREAATMTSARLTAEGEWGHPGLAARERATARLRRLKGPDDERLDQLIASFARASNSDVALLCQPGGKGQPPVLVCSRALGAARKLAARPHEGGFVDRALGAQRAVLGSLYPLLDRPLVQAGHRPLTHAVAAPVRAETGVGGALIGGFHREPRNRSWTLWAAESYAALFALALESPCAIEGLLKEARTDVLTDCLTYDSTRRDLAREVSRSTRARLELSCYLIHLDGFNCTPDQHRNEMLTQVATVLRDSVRSYDTVGQYGCDQLVVLLPHTNGTEARRIAARLESVTATAHLPGLEPPLTASIGFATWAHGESAEQLLARARTAQLAAKAPTTEVASKNAAGTTAA